jgi:lysozyme family protein
MADFNIARKLLAIKEAGYQNLAADPGNYTQTGNTGQWRVGIGTRIGTNWGISAPVLNAYMLKHYGRAATVSDMVNLPFATATQIYKAQYWDVINGDIIKDQQVANIIFDGFSSSGYEIHKYVSAILTNYNNKGITKSNVFSPSIITNVINKTDSLKLFNDIKASRIAHYKTDPSASAFLQGWLNRMAKFAYDNKQVIKVGGIGLIVICFVGAGILLIYNYYKKHKNS